AGAFGAFGEPMEAVRRWDGTRWSAFSPRLAGPGSCIGVFQGDLVIGGYFTGAAGDHISRWGGSSGQPVGPGLDGPVMQISSFQGRLVAAGPFSHAGAVAAPGLAEWNGVEWRSIAGLSNGSGTGRVIAMVPHGDELIVAGRFDTAGNI